MNPSGNVRVKVAMPVTLPVGLHVVAEADRPGDVGHERTANQVAPSHLRCRAKRRIGSGPRSSVVGSTVVDSGRPA